MGKSLPVAKKGETSVVPISSEQTLKASKALLSHMQKAAKEAAASADKKNLLEESTEAETPIWLTATTKRNVRDTNKLKPGRVTLPHPLNRTDPETTICLIVADPQRFYKDVVASEEFPEALGKRITRVVDLKHLQAKFKTFEAQRKLFSEHDVFLADDRIINRLPKALGKTFFKTTAKRPVPVKLHRPDKKADGAKSTPGQKKAQKEQGSSVKHAKSAGEMAKEIEAAVGAALVHLTQSTNTAVKIGYAAFTPQQIAENAEAVATALVEKFIPRGIDNLRALYLKGPETAALPIWQTEELWLDGDKDILAEGSEELKALEAKEKANVGKKRKAPAVDGQSKEEEQVDAAAEVEKPAKKKSKKAKVDAESNDAKLDAQIKERKEKLKKQKKAAKAAMEE